MNVKDGIMRLLASVILYSSGDWDSPCGSTGGRCAVILEEEEEI